LGFGVCLFVLGFFFFFFFIEMLIYCDLQLS